MKDQSQLMRGILEGCILKIISTGETYGYAIVEQLRLYGFEEMTEGTVYPLLLRIEKNEWVSHQKRPSPQGPMRKYYTLTALGEKALTDFEASWKHLEKTVKNIFELEALS